MAEVQEEVQSSPLDSHLFFQLIASKCAVVFRIVQVSLHWREVKEQILEGFFCCAEFRKKAALNYTGMTVDLLWLKKCWEKICVWGAAQETYDQDR